MQVDEEDTILESSDPGRLQSERVPAFSSAYKRAILRQLESAPETMRGILEREGLFYADVLRWREQEARGELHDSSPPPVLSLPDEVDEARETIAELETRLKNLNAEVRLTEDLLEQARASLQRR